MAQAAPPANTVLDFPHVGVSQSQKQLGKSLIIGGTALLLISSLLQLLHTQGWFDHGFDNWRPILYIYVLWAVLLCSGIVIIRGEHGKRALFVLPAILFTLSMVIFPTIFGLY